MSVVIETTIGDFTVDLFAEERPVACSNFLKLCKLKYYNYNLFHTIEHGFIAQSGDPGGTGTGGSSVWGILEGSHKRFFEAEYVPKIHHTTAGLVSLVGVGKNLVGSQFLITLGDNLTSLDDQHCVIGEVVEGHEVLRQLNEAIVDETFRPYQDIRITHTVILDDPFEDPHELHEPSRSPSPSAERLQNGRIAADEDIDDTAGKSMEEIQEMLAEREAKARATILEIVGDLPDVDIAPPENVLFVCKLNPVTTDDDLEIIFSRFGCVKNCEVIRDSKTGDSLQYAFVEFEDKKACEAAYFKMDNVLIDDRRIHVDFSQSVSKVKWSGKGRGIKGDVKGVDFNNLRDDQRRHRREDRRQKMERYPKERDLERNVRHNDRERKRYRSISRERERNGKNSRTISNESHKRREEKYKCNERRDYRSKSRSLSKSRSRQYRQKTKHREKHDKYSKEKSARSRSRDKSRYAERHYESHSRCINEKEMYNNKDRESKRENKHESVKEKVKCHKESSRHGRKRTHKSINSNKESRGDSSSDVAERSSEGSDIKSTSSSNSEERRRRSKKKHRIESKVQKDKTENSRHYHDTKSHMKRR